MTYNSVDRTILGTPAYFFVAGIAIVVSFSVYMIILLKKNYQAQDITTNMKILAASVIVMLLSARMFGILSGIYRSIGDGKKITWDCVNSTGIVFYGGLMGLIVAYKVFLKISKQEPQTLDLLAVVIPLFHSISRIGCFLGGCCFGKESSGIFSIEYTTVIANQVNTAQRIPTQLYESFFNICLFVILLIKVQSKDWKEKKLIRKYLWAYSIWRFIIEFIRGDTVRGIILGVSFSQLISVIIIVYLVLSSLHSKKRIKEEYAL